MATCILTFQTVITFEVLGFLSQIMEIWKACEKCFQKMITSSSTESVARFVWCKKRCKYQTMFETNMCSIHFLHSNAHHTPKTHQLHHIFEEYLFINILCLVSQVFTKKGPTDSILLGEVIRVGSKALVVVRKLHHHCSNPLEPKLTDIQRKHQNP